MYNYLGELCILILSTVLLFNTAISFSLREKKHLYFLLCVVSIVLSTFSNILSINCIENFNPDKILSSSIITTIYFISLGLIQFFFAIYCYEFVSPNKKYKKFFMIFILIPFVVYYSVLLLNPFFGFIFRYDSELGYTRGSLKNITYISTIYYAVLILVCVHNNRRNLSKRTRIVFIIYPFLGLGITMIQFFSTYSVMTGTSSFATALLVYLSVQSDLLEYDIQTGLLTEKHLAQLVNKKPHGMLTVISIENFATLEGSLSSSSFNQFILSFATKLYSFFGRSAYHISANKFAIFSEGTEPPKDKIEKIFDEFGQILTEDNTTHHIEFLAACVDLPKNAEDYEIASDVITNLLSNARSKKGIKIALCDENYLAESKRTQAVYTILDREIKLDSSQLQIYYQPIYSVKEKRFVYAEALSRLKNTEIGDISPAEFIAVAESKGLIERLGDVVFEKVCDFISRNKDEVQAVSVNFSVYQMVNPTIVDYVLTTIKNHGISPENIIMEITESIFVDDFDLIRAHMIQLSKAGIRFYLDDFGTGYSNFANVVALPFSTIKIDRSFVLMMETNADIGRMINSLIRTFKEDGLKILFEGVETPGQDEMVKKTNPDFIQGFLYSRPVPEERFLTLMHNENQIKQGDIL